MVLIVEDDAQLGELFATCLAPGCTVRTATSAAGARDALDGDLDVALLDRRLPDGSGDEIAAAIRDRGIDCGVVLVTAVEPTLELAALPIDAYLTKPVRCAELRRTVEELLFRLVGGADRRRLLALLSRAIVLEEQYPADRLETEPEYRTLRRRIALAEERLGVAVRPASGHHRPDACPACALRWDVTVDDAVGYIAIASRVWKCRRCGHVANLPDPHDRYVARG